MAEERVSGGKGNGKAAAVKATKGEAAGKPRVAATKTGGAKTAKAADAESGPVRGGLAQTVTPDAALAKVIGGDPATRAEITKRIWEYVRKNALQDKSDGRVIHADERLKPVFGGKEQVTMFEMTKLVNQHVG
ncbi:MAG: SWIB/MDM2 domain-containing protein [Pseudomonadota bacterium]|nr:SWIB/MDM2 domain-containing protein [Pseudomonadota bacterium]